MKKSGLYIISFVMICLFISCHKKVSQEELIQSALSLKIEQWRKDQMKECEAKAMLKAEAYVDSMLIVNSLSSKLDTIPKPPRPMKPPKPSFKTKPDSVVVDRIN
ncbi:MAG TPA: hypothetical protein VMZ69_03500 [Saprospiraceae bacterium]|nr:hypothetical protein [Saprospiraceae bacterium]